MSSQYLHWAYTRKASESKEFRVLSSELSVGDTASEKGVLGFLNQLNDITIAPNCGLKLQVDKDSVIVIIPLVGVLEIFENDEAVFLEPSKYSIKSIAAHEVYEIRNPYDTDHINFIQLNLSKDIFIGKSEVVFGEFNLDDNLNNLVSIGLDTLNYAEVYMGKFGCNKESFLTDEDSFDAYFFVINGSFEVNGMLLHPRDSASFAEINMLDFESLSEESMLIVLISS
jgi:quercetin 2,3-dioxygenase